MNMEDNTIENAWCEIVVFNKETEKWELWSRGIQDISSVRYQGTIWAIEFQTSAQINWKHPTGSGQIFLPSTTRTP